MRVLNLVFILFALPGIAYSADAIQVNPSTSSDTFGLLLDKQVQLIDSELDAKIRANKNQGGLPNSALGSMPANATPLLEAKQDYSDQEPVLEAIWGVIGEEVAELNYQGRHIPVSMQEPYISKIDGWKLESITPYSITLLKMDGKRIQQRKSITLDWRNQSVDAAVRPVAHTIANQ